MSRKYKSKALAALHESLSDLHEIGIVPAKTMKEFDEICTKNRIKAQQALEQAAKEYIAREIRYLKGKEECRAALHGYLQTGETVDEDEMERFISERLKSNGVEL